MQTQRFLGSLLLALSLTLTSSSSVSTSLAAANAEQHARLDTASQSFNGTSLADSPDLLLRPELAFTDERCSNDAESVEHANRLRAAVELQADAKTVTESFDNAAYRCTAFGVPMTPDELALYAAVLDAQGELSEAVEAMSEDPVFGGAYFEGAELTIVSTTGQLGASLNPHRGSIRLLKADYSHATLRTIAHAIAEATKTKADDGPYREITRIRVNPGTNRVEVGVQTGVDSATAEFRKLYGDPVTVFEQDLGADIENYACTINDCGTRGGVAVNHFSPIASCTSAFVVRAKRSSLGAWARYMLTAGHCIADAGGESNVNPWQNGAGTIVWGTNRVLDYGFHECEPWHKCEDNDQGLFRLGSALSPYNRYNVAGTVVEILGRTAYSNQIQGQFVYRNGRASGLDGGTIANVWDLYAGSCFPYTCRYYTIVEVSMQSAKGDSGAGFYRLSTDRRAYGTLKGGLFGRPVTFYNPWDNVFYDTQENHWYIEPCIQSGCPL